eukprot:Skav215085  [mRNA]  locus=scaffold1068:30653:45574:+ [translate_table: standard]
MNLLADVPSRRLPVSVVAVNSAIAAGFAAEALLYSTPLADVMSFNAALFGSIWGGSASWALSNASVVTLNSSIVACGPRWPRAILLLGDVADAVTCNAIINACNSWQKAGDPLVEDEFANRDAMGLQPLTEKTETEDQAFWKYDAPYVLMANTGAAGRFNRVQRAVFNTDESLPGYVYGRVSFAVKYKNSLKARGAGFLPSMIGEKWMEGPELREKGGGWWIVLEVMWLITLLAPVAALVLDESLLQVPGASSRGLQTPSEEGKALGVLDQDVRFWKDRLLYQIRRFRQIVGRSLDQGQQAFDQIPDAVEKDQPAENLGGFASHALQQIERRNSTAPWPWELTPAAALIPGSSLPPVRVYVYDEFEAPGLGPLTRSAAFCHYRQWGMDVGFHDFFRTSPVRTFEPEEADYFFVPSYACCHQVAGMADFPDLDRDHEKAVSQLAYFHRAGGREACLHGQIFSVYMFLPLGKRTSVLGEGVGDTHCLFCPCFGILQAQDHIFSFHYIDLFPSWRKRIPKSVVLTPETEVGFERSLDDFGLDQTRFPPFNPLKDIVVPPSLDGKREALGSRSILASFAGKLWPAESVAEAAEVRDRVAALGSAPGFRALDTFVIKWPVSRIDESLVSFLTNLPLDVARRYIANGRNVRCWYLYPPPEVSWIGDWQTRQFDCSKGQERHELEEVEKHVCPNLSSSRNAFQAVVEILARRKVSSGSPVSKVVALLQGMKQQLDSEASEEAELMEKHSCWCKDCWKEGGPHGAARLGTPKLWLVDYIYCCKWLLLDDLGVIPILRNAHVCDQPVCFLRVLAEENGEAKEKAREWMRSARV